MKVFEVWGELSLKDTLTQDLAAIQTKVNQAATGIQQSLGKINASSGLTGNNQSWIKATEFHREYVSAMQRAEKDAYAQNQAFEKLKLENYTQSLSAMRRAERDAYAEKLRMEKELTRQIQQENEARKNIMAMKSGDFRNYLKTGEISKEVSNLDAAMARFQRTLMAFAGITALMAIGEGFNKLVNTAMHFNETMEKSKLGIASLISAQNDIVTSDGRRLEGIEKLNAAMNISSRIIQQLRVDNLQTVATFEQLLRVFQQGLGPGQQAGLGLDQIRQISLGMVQAASALDIPLDMMAEEVRSVFRGQISVRNTLIASILGMDAETIRSLQGNAQGLFQYIMGFLDNFQIAGIESQKTWSGLLSNVKDAFAEASGGAFTGFFENAKLLAKDLLDSMMTFDKTTRTVRLNPEFVDGIKIISDTLQGAVTSMYYLVKGSAELAGSMARLGKKVFNPLSMIPTPVGEGGLSGLLGIDISGANKEQLRKYQESIMKEVEGFRERLIRANKTNASDYFGMMISNPAEYLNRAFEDSMSGGNLKISLQQLEKIRDALNKAGEDTKSLNEYMNALKDPSAKVTEEMKNAALGISEFELIAKRIVNIQDEWKKQQHKVTDEITKSKSELYETQEIMRANNKNNDFVIKNYMEYRRKYQQLKSDLEKEAGNSPAAQAAVSNRMAETDILLKEKLAIDNRNDALKIANDIIEENNKLLDINRDLRRGFSTENIGSLQGIISPAQNNFEQQSISLLEKKLKLELDIRRIKSEPYEVISSGGGGFTTIIDWESLVNSKVELKEVNEQLTKSATNAKMLQEKFNYLENARIGDSANELNRILEKQTLSTKDMEKLQQISGQTTQERLKLETEALNLDMDRLKIQQEMERIDTSTPEGYAYYQYLQQTLGLVEQKIVDNIDRTRQWEEQALNVRYALETMVPETMMNEAEKLDQIRNILLGIYDYSNMNINITFDSGPITQQLDNLISRMQQVMALKSQLSGGSAGPLGGFSLGETFGNMESDYVINFMGSASPVKPIGQTISDVIDRLNNLPGGMDYQINFLMNKAGLDASTSAGIVGANMNLNSLYAQLNQAQEQQHYYEMNRYDGYARPSTGPMADYYANTVIPKLENMIQQAQLSLYSSFGNYSPGNNSKNASASGSGSSGGGVSVQIGSIVINAGSGDAREQAITLADRIDEELARKFKSSDSKLLNSIRKGSLK